MINEDKSIKLRTKKTRLKINSKGSLSKCKTSEWINFSLPTQWNITQQFKKISY